MTIQEFIADFKKTFTEKISVKTGWGKNEILKQLDDTIYEIVLKGLKTD